MSIAVGEKVPGKVSGITNFGAFVDLGSGKTGLVHISEVSSGYVKDINDVLSVGDAVNVKIVSVGDDGKIGLSIRQAVDNPPPAKPKVDYAKAKKPNFRSNTSSPVGASAGKQDFDSLMSSFMKDSDDRLSSLKRNTEGKRGGRGGRRN